MKKTIQIFAIILAISTLTTNDAKATIKSSITKTSTAAPIAQLVPAVLKNFYAVFSNTKNLNYYKAKEVVFPVPEMGKEVVFSWGFKGSGKLFTPFTPLTAQIRESYGQSHNNMENSTVVKRTVCALIQDELSQATKESSFVQALTKPELNPVILFGIKTILLLKTTIETKQPGTDAYAKATTELMRLLFRLKLSCNYHGSEITSLFPEKFRQATEVYLPGMLGLINDLWKHLNATTLEQKNTQDYVIDCFVFNDQEFAQTMESKLSKYKKENFVEIATDLINNNEHEIVDLSKLEEVKESKYLQKLVGFFHATDLNNANLPREIKEANKELKTQLITTENGQQWLVHTSQQNNSVKAMLLCLAQTLHNYVALKKELLTGTGLAAVEYRKRCEDRDAQAEIIQDFLEEFEGKSSIERLSKEIYAITQPAKAKLLIIQKNKQQKDELTTTLQNLKNQYESATAEIKSDHTVLNAQEIDETQRTIIQARIKSNIQQRTVIDQQIQEIQATINTINVTIYQIEQEPEVQHELNLQNLEELRKLSAEQQAQGNIPTAQLLSTIKELQAKIGQNLAPISFERRMHIRQQVADLLTQEASYMESKSKKEEISIKNIASQEQRSVKQLLWNSMNKKYTTYISHLQQEAKNITADTEKALTLKQLKEACAKQTIEQTPAVQEEIRNLEDQVGALLSGQQEEDFIDLITCTQSDIQEMLTDLSTNEAFKQVKNNLIESLTKIKQNSTFVQRHSALFQELMNMIGARYPLLAATVTRKI